MLIPNVLDTGKGHWLETLALTFQSLRQILKEIEPEAYEEATKQTKPDSDKQREELDKKMATDKREPKEPIAWLRRASTAFQG
jgi:hypothetical protein